MNYVAVRVWREWGIKLTEARTTLRRKGTLGGTLHGLRRVGGGGGCTPDLACRMP